MNAVAYSRFRHTILVLAVIGLVVLVAACTPNEGPSAPTVAPTLASASPVPGAVASATPAMRA